MSAEFLSNDDGSLLRLYHGTITPLNDFDVRHDMGLNRDGAGIYLTSSPIDAAENYANPESAEWSGKMMALADKGGEAYSVRMSNLKEQACPVIYPVMVSLNRPFIVGDEPLPDINRYQQPLRVALFHSLKDMSQADIWSEKIIEFCKRKAGKEGVTGRQFRNTLHQRGDYQFGIKDLFSQVCKGASHDGIIDKTAGELWSVPNHAWHIVAFKSESVYFELSGRRSRSQRVAREYGLG